MSLDLILGFTGLMSLGHAAFFGLGAYAVAVLGTQFGLNAWLGLGAGVVLAAGGAALIGFFCVRTGGTSFLMLTLAFSQLVFSVALEMARRHRRLRRHGAPRAAELFRAEPVEFTRDVFNDALISWSRLFWRCAG